MRASVANYVSWLLSVTALTSCVSPKGGCLESQTGQLPISVLTNLPRRISLDQLKNRTGIKPQHQFTARLETNDVLCVSLSFEHPRGYLHFLFRNGGLASIQSVPTVEFVLKTNHGIRVRVPLPVHPEAHMTKVIHGNDLSPDEIAKKIEQWSRGEAQRAKGSEPMNILPAVILSAPVSLAQWPARARARREAEKLAGKFDPFKIALGMTADEAKARFGDPDHRHVVSSDCEWRCYGSDLSGLLPVHVSPVWVSVVFCDGKVTRVFSHDFFHKGPLEILKERG